MRNRYRPVLSLPYTRLEILLVVFTVLGIIIGIALTVWGWLTLPAIIPTHYGLSDTPNAYGGKGSLLILPIVSVCLAVLLIIMSRYPHKYNYPWPITAENAPRQYTLARLVLLWVTFDLVWMVCGLQWFIIQAAQSYVIGPILFVPLAMILVLFITIILYILAAIRAR